MEGLTTQKVADCLKKLGYTLHQEEKRLYLEETFLEDMLFVDVGILSQGQLLQLITPLGKVDDPKKFGEIARALHVLNRELDLPGFGLDETQSLVFYRTVIPAVQGVLDPRIVKMHLLALAFCAKLYEGIRKKVLDGSLDATKDLRNREQ